MEVKNLKKVAFRVPQQTRMTAWKTLPKNLLCFEEAQSRCSGSVVGKRKIGYRQGYSLKHYSEDSSDHPRLQLHLLFISAISNTKKGLTKNIAKLDAILDKLMRKLKKDLYANIIETQRNEEPQ